MIVSESASTTERIRLLMISRRFWPSVGGAEQMMASLASELQEHNVEVKIITARWHNSWPNHVVHRGVPVVRLAQPATRGWGTLKYMWTLNRYLRQNKGSYDAVLVSMLKHCAYVACHTLRNSPIPVICRAEGGGDTGDCRWQEKGNFGIRIRRKVRDLAAKIIAPSPAIEDELLKVGFGSNQVKFVPNGVALQAPQDNNRMQAARKTLCDANGGLCLHSTQPMVVYVGRLHPKKGLDDLVRAWRIVIKQMPSARLWIIGEGEYGQELWAKIQDAEIAETVAMPGAFDDVLEVLYAANVFVLPSHEEGMSLSLLEAMSAGVPVVATDIPGNRKLIEPDLQGRLVPPKSPTELAGALLDLLNERSPAKSMAEQARARVREQYSLRQSASAHLDLIRNAIQQYRTTS
jgi:glycosyltransferase involved in cell wall biosynthesis